MAEPQRCLVLIADGAGPAAWGCYGQERFDTPTLDRWASEGIVFDHHIARYLHTSHEPAAFERVLIEMQQSGVVTAWAGPEHSTWQSLPWSYKRSWRRDTGAPWSAIPLGRALAELWEVLPDDRPILVVAEVDALLPPWRVDLDTLDDEVDETESEPEAVANEAEPLDPWLGDLPAKIDPDDDASRVRMLLTNDYLVEEIDGMLLAVESEFAEGWALALTARRGLPLGEHGQVGFGTTEPHEEAVHLPLVIRLPDGRDGGLRFSGLTQPADFWQWIATKLAGTDSPFPRHERLFIDTPTHQALRTPDELLIVPHAGPPLLYRKPADRWEVNDMAPREPDRVDELLRQLTINPEASASPDRP